MAEARTRNWGLSSVAESTAGNGHKITNWEKFREFVEVNGDKTQVEMVSLWQGEISARTISIALKKIGFSRKKKLMVIESEMKLND
jgi:hypothetical protein